MSNERRITRRYFFFLSGAAMAAAGCATKTSKTAVTTAANSKLNIAGIGAGGRAGGDLNGVGSENIVALCDVDEGMAAESRRKWPNARFYRDYREMLDKEANNIDAVVIATPDHTHAVAAMASMQLGKHVYVEKPLTHSIYEADQLLKAARQYKVATQMGNQGHSGNGVRELCELLWAGAIGDISEVHIWTNRPVWPQGRIMPTRTDPVPDSLSWDLWLGPAPERPYCAKYPEEGKPESEWGNCYAPFVWRGWWDFGCGALGDMGCHIMDPAFWALDLTAPSSVECTYQEGMTDQQGPVKAIVKYEFPARYNQFAKKDMGPTVCYWYEGGLLPERPADIPADQILGDSDGKNGSLFIGSGGYMTTGCYGGDSRIVPNAKWEEYKAGGMPEQVIPRIPGQNHHQSWVTACKGGDQAASNFEYSVPLTKTVLLGNLAVRSAQKVYWDNEKMQATNNVPDVEALVRREYRNGWSL